METGSRDNHFDKCCYQEKPRNREVGGGRHKTGDFLKMRNIVTLWNVNENGPIETDYCCRRERK